MFAMGYVTLRRLEVLVAIADEGSFAAAADRLNIAQPSVSAHVQALEREFGGRIFERRRGGRPRLTELGRSVLQHAREMMAEAEDLRADIVSIRRTEGKRVVLSCQRSLANYALKSAITQFALQHPTIQLVVRIGKQEDVVAELRDATADVGCFLGNEDIRGIRSEVIGTQRLVLVATPEHPLAGRRVKPGEVRRHSFVGPPPASLFGRAVTKLLSNVGIKDLKVVAQATEYQFLRELVIAGVGLSCSPETSVQADIASGHLAVIDLDAPDLTFDIRLASSLTRPLSDEASVLIRFLRARCGSRGDPQGPALSGGGGRAVSV
jgi:molybdate transport repressor ModE-like protein